MELSFRKKKYSALLRGKTSKHHDDFDCLNCLPSLRTKKTNAKINVENKDFCNVVMPSEVTKILDFNENKNLIRHHLLFMQSRMFNKKD